MEGVSRTVKNPWDDPGFVLLHEEDVRSEQDGTADHGANREELLARYEKYLAD